MKTKRGAAMSLVVAGLFLLLSACGFKGMGSVSPTPTAKPRTAIELLKSSATAMKQLTAEHIVMNVNMSLGGSTFDPLSLTPTTDSSATPTPTADTNQSTITMKMEKDISTKPEQSIENVSMNMAMGSMTINYGMKEVTKGDKVYVQNLKGTWYVIDKSVGGDTTDSFFAFSQMADLDKLLDGADKGKITDHGVENVKGVRLRHLTVTMDQSFSNHPIALPDLTPSVDGGDSGDGATPDASQHLSMNMTDVVDFWIDEMTSYVNRFDMKFAMNSGTDVQSNAAKASGTSMELTADYSNFNKPFTVTIPKNATPADSVSAALYQV